MRMRNLYYHTYKAGKRFFYDAVGQAQNKGHLQQKLSLKSDIGKMTKLKVHAFERLVQYDAE